MATVPLAQEGATAVHPGIRAGTHLPSSHMPWTQEPWLLWTPVLSGRRCGLAHALHGVWTPACGPSVSSVEAGVPLAPGAAATLLSPSPGLQPLSQHLVSPPLGVRPKARLGTEIQSLAIPSLVGEKRFRKAQKPLPRKTPTALTTALAAYHMHCRGRL